MGTDARLGSEPLVGRQHERAALAQLAVSVGGGARVLVLIGPAGAGKTALWSYGQQVVGSVARVLTCRPGELAARASYSGLSELVDALPAEMEMLSVEEKRALLTATHPTSVPSASPPVNRWCWRLTTCNGWIRRQLG
jgi:ABC-type uncharacterized transport system YnjBCD ATPase subunit